MQLQVKICPGATNHQMRELVRKHPRGRHAIQICSGCGRFWVREDGDVKNATITKNCYVCDNKISSENYIG